MNSIILYSVIFVFQAWWLQPHRPTIGEPDWLSGSWSTVGRYGHIGINGHYEEQCMKPGGKTILGMSRDVFNDAATECRFMRVIQDTSGNIYYFSHTLNYPHFSEAYGNSGREKFIKSAKGEAVFENPNSNQTMWIIYRLLGPESLVFRTENKDDLISNLDMEMKRASDSITIANELTWNYNLI